MVLYGLDLLMYGLLASLAMSIAASLMYLGYIRDKRSFLTIVQAFVFLSGLGALLLPLIELQRSDSVLSQVTLLVSLVLLSIFAWRNNFKCQNEEKIGDIGDLPVFLCHDNDRIYNAGIDLLRRKVTITKSLCDILDEREKNAVLHHELGHWVKKEWMGMAICARFMWIWFASTIIALIVLLLSTARYDLASKILVSVAFLAFLPVYAVVFMVVSWIYEHEADLFASEAVGAEPLAHALLKLYIYSSIGRCEDAIHNIQFSKSFRVEKVPSRQILFSIVKKAFSYTGLRTVLSRPIPEDHPPLVLRLEKIGLT